LWPSPRDEEEGADDIWYFVSTGNTDQVAALLAAGTFTLDQPDEDGRTPLMWAADKGVTSAATFTSWGGQGCRDLRVRLTTLRLLLHFSSYRHRHRPAEARGQGECSGRRRTGTLAAVAAFLHTTRIRHLMSRHNVVHGTRYQQQTVLHYAALSDNEEMLRLLLEHGADKTIADNDGTLPSELADNDRLRALLE
jgi:hypothetical protein